MGWVFTHHQSREANRCKGYVIRFKFFQKVQQITFIKHTTCHSALFYQDTEFGSVVDPHPRTASQVPSCCCDKSDLEEEGFILSHSSRVQSIMAGSKVAGV